ncbi:ABC protein [Mycena sanguinolenta]|uniref:ABC protein n=1 Tax=Mycena sanguinolenta TaxID=230812 RepID=A0A8H6Z6R3_9AGAR|nr:ABC protein [Mycena sanguinolenta]
MQESLEYSCPRCMHSFNLFDVDTTPALVSSDIVKSNDPPSESQVPVLQDFISKGRTRMAALESKIELLDSLMDKLVEEKNELAAEICMHEGSLSPLRRMPTEILSHIFAFTLPPHHPGAEPAPWTVSAVCARWRAISVSQPCFWTTIQYDDDLNGTSVFKYRTQLSRSGQLPLNIEFRANYWGVLTPEARRILDLVCVHSERWGSVSFMVPKEVYRQLRPVIQGSLPRLRTLEIDIPLSVYDDWDEDGQDALWDLNDAPVLHTVFFNRELWGFPLTMSLPWSQLRRYGGCSEWDTHLDALRKAPNLVDCSLEIQDWSSVTEDPVLLPHLRRLSLSSPYFLESLQTPALEELYCDYDASPILSFLQQQTCKLQKLVMWDCSMDPDPVDLTRIVEALPTIRHLACFFPLPIEFVRDFRSQSSTLAPALEDFSSFLDIDIDSGTDDELKNKFMEAIESRWRSGPLKSVKIYGPNLRIVGDRLDLLRTEGMECAVFLHEHSRSLENLDDTIPPELQILSVQ